MPCSSWGSVATQWPSTTINSAMARSASGYGSRVSLMVPPSHMDDEAPASRVSSLVEANHMDQASRFAFDRRRDHCYVGKSITAVKGQIRNATLPRSMASASCCRTPLVAPRFAGGPDHQLAKLGTRALRRSRPSPLSLHQPGWIGADLQLAWRSLAGIERRGRGGTPDPPRPRRLAL